MQIGLLASANSVATSGGTSTTGSYMRDLHARPGDDWLDVQLPGQRSGVRALVQDTSTSLNSIVNAMATDVGVLGNTQSNLTSIQTQLSATTTALSGQVSTSRTSDMATTLSNLTATQTQLQASYRLITGETSLSLVNFLPTSG